MCDGAEVRDVEALDPHRQRVQRERLAQVVERVHPLLAPPLGAQLVLLEREPRVALGELVEPPLLAAPRVPQLDRAAAALLEQLAARPRPRASDGGPDDLGRDRQRRRVVLDRELLGDLVLAAAGAVLQIEALAVRQHAVAHLEHLRVRVRVRRPRRRSRRACRPPRSRPAGARTATAPRAAGCGRRPPARTPGPPRRPAMRSSSSRSICR